MTNGAGPIYLPPQQLYDTDAYSVWSTIAPRGTHERLLEVVGEAITECPRNDKPREREASRGGLVLTEWGESR